MSRSKTFLYILISFIIGIAIRSFVEFDIFLVFVGLLAAIILIIILYKNRRLALVFLFIIFCLLGIVRYHLALPPGSTSQIQYYNEKESILFRAVVSNIDERIDHNKITVKTREVSRDQAWHGASGKVLIKAGLFPKYQYGDLLEISCYLKQPTEIEGFLYDRYLAKSDIYSTCYGPRIKLISSAQGNRVYGWLIKAKLKIHHIIKKSLPSPHSALLSAILLGERKGIPSQLNDKFSITGVSHMVAISGMHITIIAAILMSLAINIGLRRGQDFWLVVACLALYITLIGLPPSAMRAGLMAFMFLLAIKVGRLNKSINGLVLAATIMLLINPKLLRDDIGFQLSFLAVLSLLYVLPFISDKLSRLPSLGKVKEIFIVTISAQVLTMPLIVYYFGRMSLVSPLVNILVLPALPFIMVLGMVAILLALVVPSVSSILFWPAWVLIEYLIRVVEFFSNYQASALDINNVNSSLVVGFYLIVFMLILKPWRFLFARNKTGIVYDQ